MVTRKLVIPHAFLRKQEWGTNSKFKEQNAKLRKSSAFGGFHNFDFLFLIFTLLKIYRCGYERGLSASAQVTSHKNISKNYTCALVLLCTYALLTVQPMIDMVK
jgi:hypothetical protein